VPGLPHSGVKSSSVRTELKMACPILPQNANLQELDISVAVTRVSVGRSSCRVIYSISGPDRVILPVGRNSCG